MAQDPNALAAPASGFGQEVSFSFDPAGQAPSLQLASGGGPRGGVSGGAQMQRNNPSAAQPGVPGFDPTTALLMKVGEALLAPAVEQARTEQFVVGMQKAMNGEAVADMQEQRPWYSKLFGDTPVIEGARAYEANSKVNQTIAEQTANMDKLQELDSGSAAKHFSGVINSNLSGDKSTDMLIMKSMAESMPSLMKAQAKAHYGFLQKKAATALSTNMNTSAAALQQQGQMFSEDKVDDKGFAIAKEAFVASIMPPAGINEENYQKTLATNIQAMANKGQFHAIEAIRDSGGFQALTPEQQKTVEASIEAGGRRQKDKYNVDYMRELAEIRSDASSPAAGQTPQQLQDRILAANTKFKKLTGNPSPLITPDEAVSLIAGNFNYIKNEEKQAIARQGVLGRKTAKADEKAAAAAEQAQAITQAVSTGDVLQAKTRTKATDDEINIEVERQYRANPEQGDFLLRNNFIKSNGYVNPQIQAQWTGALRASEGLDAPSAGFLAEVDRYQRIKAGPGSAAMADAYYKDYGPKLEKFIRMSSGDVNNMPAAFVAAMDRTGSMKPRPLGSKAIASLAGDVSKSTNSVVPRWLGGQQNLRPDTLAILADAAENRVEEWRGVPGMTDSEATQRGIAGAISDNTVELLGGFAIRSGEVGERAPLRKLMSSKDGLYSHVPAGQEDAYFEGFLKDKVKLPEGGSTSMYRTGADAAGVPQFAGTVNTEKGAVLFRFTAKQLQDYAAERTQLETAGTHTRTRPPAEPFNFPIRTPGTPPEPWNLSFGPDLQLPKLLARDAAARADADKKRILKP